MIILCLQNNNESPEVSVSDESANEPDIPECEESVGQSCWELPGDGTCNQQCPGGRSGRRGCRYI